MFNRNHTTGLLRILGASVAGACFLAATPMAQAQVGVGTTTPTARIDVRGVEDVATNPLGLANWQDARITSLNTLADAGNPAYDVLVASANGYLLRLGAAALPGDTNTTNTSFTFDPVTNVLTLTDSDGNTTTQDLSALAGADDDITAVTPSLAGTVLTVQVDEGATSFSGTVDLAPLGGVDTNFAQNDLTLDANRTHTLNGFSATFDGAGSNTQIESNGAISVLQDGGASSITYGSSGIGLFTAAIPGGGTNISNGTAAGDPFTIATFNPGGIALNPLNFGAGIDFGGYGIGTYDDPAPARVLGVDAAGNVVEVNPATFGATDTALGTHDQIVDLTASAPLVAGQRTVSMTGPNGARVTYDGSVIDTSISQQGWLGVNTILPAFLANVNQQTEVDVIGDMRVSGSIYYGGVLIGDASFAVSDRRLKSDVEDFDGGMGILRALDFKSFRYNSDEDQRTHYGVIAQDLAALDANLVTEFTSPSDGEDYLAVNTTSMMFVLADALQQTEARLSAVEAELAQRDAMLADMAARLEALEAAALN